MLMVFRQAKNRFCMGWDGLKQVLTRLGAPNVAHLRKLWVDGGPKGSNEK